MQKLILKPIAKALAKADTNDGSTPDPIILKLFTPWGGCTWFIVSGTPLDAINGEATTVENAKDWHLFGFCDLGDARCAELGYVLLSELQSIRGPFGLKIERDIHFDDQSLRKIMSAAPYNRQVEAPTPEAIEVESEKYRFIEDPGHGWLEVPTDEIARLCIADKISSYSYVSADRKTAYLEEDSDLSVFCRAKDWTPGAAHENWERDFQNHTFVRGLERYSPIHI
jgi:hypothetical protein